MIVEPEQCERSPSGSPGQSAIDALIGRSTGLGARIASIRTPSGVRALEGVCSAIAQALAGDAPESRLLVHASLVPSPTSTRPGVDHPDDDPVSAQRRGDINVRLRAGPVDATGPVADADRSHRTAILSPDLPETLPATPFAWERRDLFDDQAWQRAELRSKRTAAGLHAFAIAIAPIEGGGAVLRVDLDATDPAWSASRTDLALLRGAARAGADMVARLFVEPDARREELLRPLGPAQRAIAPLLATGRSERDIAEQLGRSAHTVHEHAKRIYRAWGVSNRFQMRDKWLGAEQLPGYELAQR